MLDANISCLQSVDVEYKRKKSVATGLLDLALLSANANQIRHVLNLGVRDFYYIISLFLLTSCLILQILVALVLIAKASHNSLSKDQNIKTKLARLNDFSMVGILLITILSVVSSAFIPASYELH